MMEFQKIIIHFVMIGYCFGDEMNTMIKLKSRCLNPPRTARKVESHIKICQDEVKNKIVLEAYELMRTQFNQHVNEGLTPYINSPDINDDSHHQHLENDIHLGHLNSDHGIAEDHGKNRRSSFYHPTLVPYEEKRIAGCLLHCVYAKNNAIDKLGWPTLDGLVDFYSEGVNEHGFFMATLRASNLCLKAATHKYHVNRHKAPEKGESCDVAFDVFDCISDQITGYCLDNF